MNTDFKTVAAVWKNRSKLYQPPEVIIMCNQIDLNPKNEFTLPEIDYKKVDIFQFGVCMFSLFFLMHPFRDREGNLVEERYKLI
jgi:hypothetical protein